jgi:hypothetical protein
MDFLEEYRTAAILAGTVEFPSKFPASARVTILIPPRNSWPDENFVKIVHMVYERQFTVWMAPLTALRAARVKTDTGQMEGPFAGWELKTGQDLQNDIDTAIKPFENTTKGAEVPLYASAIAFVAEFATVIMRCEIVTTAAEAAEECCDFLCPPRPPPHCH